MCATFFFSATQTPNASERGNGSLRETVFTMLGDEGMTACPGVRLVDWRGWAGLIATATFFPQYTPSPCMRRPFWDMGHAR